MKNVGKRKHKDVVSHVRADEKAVKTQPGRKIIQGAINRALAKMSDDEKADLAWCNVHWSSLSGKSWAQKFWVKEGE